MMVGNWTKMQTCTEGRLQLGGSSVSEILAKQVLGTKYNRPELIFKKLGVATHDCTLSTR